MTVHPGKGTALRQHAVLTRFESGCTPGPKQDHKLHPRIAEVRKLLRTNMAIADIAESLGVARNTLRGFIKRRNLCDMQERSHFISRQKSLSAMGEQA